MKEKLIVILGPTATGKSDLALKLAEKYNREIVSGDSMLVYKGMNIGTAKPSADELERVKHHLVDIIEPNIAYNAGVFQKEAKKIITEINTRKSIPILAGGTGLYIKSLLENYSFPEISEQPELRKELELYVKEHGNEKLYEKLYKKNPIAAEKIHPNNVKRVIRALELTMSGADVSREKSAELNYNAIVIGLDLERKKLYEKINKRVLSMFDRGLVDEVKKLLKDKVSSDAVSMQGIGYKETVLYLQGEISFDACKELVAKNTRNFAKRQITWYKSMPYIKWFDVEAFTTTGFVDNIYPNLEESFILK